MPKQEKSISNAEYASVYKRLRGPSTNLGESDVILTENMYFNKDGEGALESVPGIRTVLDLSERIHSLFVHYSPVVGEKFLIIHAGDYLYRVAESEIYDYAPIEPLCEIGSEKSTYAETNSLLYVFSGNKMVEIEYDGCWSMMDSEENSLGYVPTTFINGKRNEYRNLLTRLFTERYKVEIAEDYAYGTPELIYSIIDKEKKKCAVTGIARGYGPKIYIPRYKKIDGVNYLVTEISSNAFACIEGINTVITNRGLEYVRSAAFMNMPDLEDIYFSETVCEIGDFAFALCASLRHIALGTGLKAFGKAVFSGCVNFDVDYSGSPDMFLEIENVTILSNHPPNYYTQHQQITVAIPIFTNFEEIYDVTADYYYMKFDFIDSQQGVVLTAPSPADISGKTFTIFGAHLDDGPLFYEYIANVLPPIEMILGCTISFNYDGRTFLTGNPYMPGAVFYSELLSDGTTTPTYFSERSYFIDGEKAANIIALSTVGQSLAVYAEECGTDNVFLHKPKAADASVSYPVVSSFSHPTPIGASNYFGEALVVSKNKISRFRGSTGRCSDFEDISAPISNILSKCSADTAPVSHWNGYIAIGFGDRLLLCDASERQTVGGRDTYDWYTVSGAGGYNNDIFLYEYADEPYGSFLVNEEKVGMPKPVDSILRSIATEKGEHVFYIKEDGKSYRLYETPYKYGGEPDRITSLVNLGGRLFIGTNSGRINTFNTDMVGVAPVHVTLRKSYDPEDYFNEMGDTTHPYFYTFCGHIPTYTVITVPSDCDRPYLVKSTVRDSTVVGIKPISGQINCEAIYDGDDRVFLGSISAKHLDFCELDFKNLPLSASARPRTVLSGGRRNWLNVQFKFTGEGLSPFGLYSLAYRYTLSDSAHHKNN